MIPFIDQKFFKIIFTLTLLLGFYNYSSYAQTNIQVAVKLDSLERELLLDQAIVYKNNSTKNLDTLYLNDWNNSYKSKTTPLGKRFAEDYIRSFHYAKKADRGFTFINSVKIDKAKVTNWIRPEKHPDVIAIPLQRKLKPGDSITLNLNYRVRPPHHRFSNYGYENENFKLKYWLITPANYTNKWNFYSNKDLNDLFFPLMDLKIDLELPPEYEVYSNLTQTSEELKNTQSKQIELIGKNQLNTELYLIKNSDTFRNIDTDVTQVVTNIKEGKIQPEVRALITDRVLHFLQTKLGDYPHKKLLLTQEDYQVNPVYGFNQLPEFIRPFPDGFQYDIKLLKTIAKKYLENTLRLNPREERWLLDAIHIYLMIEYVEVFYPDVKLIGNFSDIIGIRWFHAADLDFNSQYVMLYQNMARLNLDQALTTPQDSLVKFNKNIANPYKAGIGFNYLNDYLQNDALSKTIREFYQNYKLQTVNPENFRAILEKYGQKNTDWFFNDYVQSNTLIDFKIKRVKKSKDSLEVTLKNRYENKMPVSLYTLKNDSIISKHWIEGFNQEKTVRIARDDADRIALNYEHVIPEINERNNYHRVSTLLNKPLQLRLLQDVEDSRYQQFFIMPEFDYNLYDGLTIGPKLYNKTFLRKTFNYKIAPKIGLNSGALVGSAFISNTHQYRNEELSAVQYGFSGTRYSYAKDLYYHKFSPFLNIRFRDENLRANQAQQLTIRSVNVFRDKSSINPVDEPDYSVLNIYYNYSNRNFTDYYTNNIDYQVAKKFSKISITTKWRKLFLNNRQLEFRFFSGVFLYNDNHDSDYFSFALDRPTDYLFDYNYYGRSESSGLFSQQFIEAEGGFKSQLEPAFANQWISTLNSSVTIWNWILAYGDVGFLKNKGQSADFVYDSGIRVNLVQDYFEIFFPVYSNLGWEIAHPDYDQKIRFIVSLDFNTLTKLFTRRWY